MAEGKVSNLPECPCLFCDHNFDAWCECQPCDWIRSNWTPKQLLQAGHDGALRTKEEP